jgi:hypothetical protein
MRLNKLILLCTLATLVQACGDGRSSNSNTPTNSTPPTNIAPPAAPEATTPISGSAVKGPLVGALVQAHEFDPSAENFIGDLLDVGETGPDSAVTDVEIPTSYTGIVILVVSADEDTIDLTTGEAPVITRLTTVISAAQLSAQIPIYATPLTTIALDLAVSKAGEDSSLYPSDGEAGVSEAEFLQAVSSASGQTAALLGFGLDQSVDIFSTPPIVNDSVTTPAQLAASTAYRTAIEGVSAVVVLLQEAAENVNADTTLTTTNILAALAQDITDGDIDGESDQGAIEAITEIEGDGSAIEILLTTDPSTLFVPGTTIAITQIGQLLIEEAETTSTEDTVLEATDYSPQMNATVSDIDGDGVADTADVFPTDETESIDADQDGVGDNGDAFPEDATESADSDQDGVGDNADAFPNNESETNDTDNDGTGDNSDVFPDDPTESADTDNDGVGDNTDTFPNDANETIDTDNDGVGDNGDVFPTDQTETSDSDSDGVGDNTDTFPNNANETIDTDNDGVGDNGDAFPNDANETIDTDNDGVGDNGDAFPADQTETSDSDSDGVGDNTDTFPNNANETIDTDNDGVGDNGDAFPNDANETIDTDNDGVGDNGDAFPADDSENTDSDDDGVGDNSDNCPTIANFDQADADRNNIGDACDDGDGSNAVWGQSNWNDSNWQ